MAKTRNILVILKSVLLDTEVYKMIIQNKIIQLYIHNYITL